MCENNWKLFKDIPTRLKKSEEDVLFLDKKSKETYVAYFCNNYHTWIPKHYHTKTYHPTHYIEIPPIPKPEWMPIETAPKDGTRVWGCTVTNGIPNRHILVEFNTYHWLHDDKLAWRATDLGWRQVDITHWKPVEDH